MWSCVPNLCSKDLHVPMNDIGEHKNRYSHAPHTSKQSGGSQTKFDATVDQYMSFWLVYGYFRDNSACHLGEDVMRLVDKYYLNFLCYFQSSTRRYFCKWRFTEREMENWLSDTRSVCILSPKFSINVKSSEPDFVGNKNQNISNRYDYIYNNEINNESLYTQPFYFEVYPNGERKYSTVNILIVWDIKHENSKNLFETQLTFDIQCHQYNKTMPKRTHIFRNPGDKTKKYYDSWNITGPMKDEIKLPRSIKRKIKRKIKTKTQIEITPEKQKEKQTLTENLQLFGFDIGYITRAFRVYEVK